MPSREPKNCVHCLHDDRTEPQYHKSFGLGYGAGKKVLQDMTTVQNKRIGFDYTILEEIEAGLELLGFEVKSLRAGRGSLKGARVVARGGEAYLVGASIPAWQIANAPKSYDPERTRRLLLSKKEIAHVSSAEGEKG